MNSLWLSNNKLIIDDSDIVELPERLIKCDYNCGLTNNEVKKALMLLK